ncbi:MAG: aldo/keto reductase [Clostridiaceae bacterium]|nr:aldo/keto reductase [Clostridiaceae bacterium]
MQYRKFGKFDIEVSALGFGCMRLPLLADGSIDEPESIRLVRDSIDRGLNYVDTAYPYHGGKSELLVAKALKDGYREKVFLATKCPVWNVKTPEDFDRLLNEQLGKLETDHIDMYMLHAVSGDRWKELQELNAFEFLQKAKADGRIRYAGFSFHDNVTVFKDMIDAHDWDFCQIQYNYMDQTNQAGTEGLRYAAAKEIAVIVMEPLLGGKLAKPAPKAVQKIWDSASVRRSPAAWALSWLWDQPEVALLLSGMNAQDQLDENLEVAEYATPGFLTDDERALVEKARVAFEELAAVPCTGCEYCMPCPFGVDIPGIFRTYNQAVIYDDFKGSGAHYRNNFPESEKATNCTACGACEAVCPQKIQIIEKLKEAHTALMGD